VSTPIQELLAIMRTLRDPDKGCPWDLQQDFRSLAPYAIEEAYEVADAIERGDPGDLRDELGDLLFQVVFHAQLAQEQGLFAFDDVVSAINRKMIDRHPHVFGDATIADAATRAGRDPEEVRLVAVSKTHAPEAVLEVLAAGQTVFGESRVQEARAKIPLLPSRARWHFIGHLQKNKIRQALALGFELFHGVDSLELARDIDRISGETGFFIPIGPRHARTSGSSRSRTRGSESRRPRGNTFRRDENRSGRSDNA
jgi:NTP pyrophosphatase (non-canonical NTP hydrolase)